MSDLKNRAKRLSRKLNLSELDATIVSEGNAQAVKELLQHTAVAPPAPARRNRRGESRLVSTPDKEDIYFSAYLPIHTACQSRKSPKDVIKILLESGDHSITDKTVNGDTALHVACTSSNREAVEALLSSSEQKNIVSCLRHQNKEGNTPLHLAAQHGNADITILLLDHLWDPRLSPSISTQVMTKVNKSGESSIGLAIRNEHWNSVRHLLQRSYDNPARYFVDFLACAPECSLIDTLQAYECDPIDVFFLGDSESGKTTLINTLQQATMSTFAKIAAAIPFFGNHSITESCKLGIVPLTVEYQRQDHTCPTTLHDVNNHRDYSHEALFKCSRNPLEALYVITVDLRKDVEDNILYWLNFLQHLLSDYRHCIHESVTKTSKMKLKVMLVGTFHNLAASSRPAVASKIDFSSIVKLNEDLASQFIWCGDYCINTRKLNSFDMPLVLSAINDQCRTIHADCLDPEARSSLPQTYILAGLLLKECTNTYVTTFSDVIGLVQYTDNMLCMMLPKEDEKIEMLCHNLRHFDCFKILSFGHPTKIVNYIVFDYKHLLSKVEYALDALRQESHHGIVTRRQIADVLNGCYRTEFIIKFLDHLNLSEHVSRQGLEYMRSSIRSSRRSRASINSYKNPIEIPIPTILRIPPAPRQHRRTKSDSTTLDSDVVEKDRGMSASTQLTTSHEDETFMEVAVRQQKMVAPSRSISVSKLYSGRKPTASNGSSARSSRKSSKRSTASSRQEPHYFIPSLITNTRPKILWDKGSGYDYGFAWSLVPQKEEKWFLSPKFTTIVLFRLLFSFAPHPVNPKSFLERQCQLWDRGIHWSDPVGARVCVTISDDNKITLSMQCLIKHEMECLSIRNEIMTDIKQQLKEVHPDITPREIFIPFDDTEVSVFPIFDPLNLYVLFDKMEMREAILENRPVMCTNGRQHKELDCLVHFEPLCFLVPSLLEELLLPENHDRQITDDFCMQFAKNLSTKWVCLAQHLDMVLKKYYIDSLREDPTQRKEPHDTAMEMLSHLRQIDYGDDERIDTFGGLSKSLFEISIFTENDYS